MNRFAEFNRYTNCPVVNYKDHLYNLPFNMNTFAKIWPTVITPEDAKSHIEEQSSVMAGKSPRNLEEQAISLVGHDIYKILVKGYTEKQWGRDCAELPPCIIKRLPPIAKDSFFETIACRGPLPCKSFSMGEADEKRFFLECRRLF